jgi:ribosomal protein S12 methylthiotransferase
MCPGLTLRSTFIAGFPGETEAEFQELLDFLSEAQLDRVGCFAYSPVEGAAANALPGAVPAELREERRERLMRLQESISAARLGSRIGSRITVLVDESSQGRVTARSAADAPEIDGVVHIAGGAGLTPGDFVEVEVTGADTHDLHARAVSRPEPDYAKAHSVSRNPAKAPPRRAPARPVAAKDAAAARRRTG